MPKAPLELNRAFRIIAFDWDGTAVSNRAEDASLVRARIERLLRTGVFVVVITGTSFANVDRQLSADIRGPHKKRLFVATNRGSEVYGFAGRGAPVLLEKRTATPWEERSLDQIAGDVRAELTSKTGLSINVIANRLNRRKIDLIPLPEWGDPPKAALPELLAAVEARLMGAGLTGGLSEAFAIAERAARKRGLVDARITSDVKHIEVGLTDKSEAMGWILRKLAAERGVAPSEILVGGDELGPIAGFPGSDSKLMIPEAGDATFVSVGPEPGGVPPHVRHLGGGPVRFGELLAAQGALHPLELPVAPEPDPLLRLEQGFIPAREHEVESLLAIGNGHLGSRASMMDGNPLSSPATFVAGTFDLLHGSSVPELALLPDWARFIVSINGRPLRFDGTSLRELRRKLDVDPGVLLADWRYEDDAGRVLKVQEARLVSRADRHLMLQSLVLEPENFGGTVVVDSVLRGVRTGTTARGTTWALAASTELETSEELRRLEGKRCELTVQIGHRYRFDRVVAVFTSLDAPRPAQAAEDHVDTALADDGVVGLVDSHEREWRRRWAESGLRVDGDEAAERALHFAVYHLVAAADGGDEHVSIGARALTGSTYKGHVFWDTEIFMLPFFALTWPEAARALLMYRFHTLAGARAKAKRLGHQGALYAWESADTGDEVAPPFALAPDGTISPLVVGTQEQHISADVAYGVWSYWTATGDDAFLLDAGAEILLETARFWASRLVRGDDGLFHIERIIGPDEYHETVDDNAYTNGMAQWNLERAADVAAWIAQHRPEDWRSLATRLDLSLEQTTQWRELAAHVYTGFDPRSGLFEQFRGYFDLEEIDLRDYESRAAPIDVLLGRERIERSRVIKQADVVMLLALLWDRFSPAVREANFRFYEPRTDHGSSLSPPVHALVAAKLGDVTLAERYFRRTADIDLANNMGNSAGGVHAGALGGLWQAAVFGFAGLTLTSQGPHVEPRLPPSWRSLSFNVRWRGKRYRLTTQEARAEIVETA